MAALTLRSVKGSPLTNSELDANFTALNDDIASRLSAAGGVMSGPLTLGSNPAGRSTSLNIGGYNADGGTGFHGIATFTNTFGSATNPHKFLRLNSAGGLEIVNSAYTAVIFSLSDSGVLSGVTLDAAAISTGTIARARLGSGTASSTTFLRGDGTWASVQSGGVSSFNTRTGDISLTSSDVTTALGFAPQSELVSGTSIRTINGQSVLGSGNIQIDGGVVSFNSRTGAVTLSSGDVTGALGFTPLNKAGDTTSGAFGIGGVSLVGYNLRVGRNLTGATTAFNVASDSMIQSDVTSTAILYRAFAQTVAAAFTLGSLTHFTASQGTFGAGSTVNVQTGYNVESNLSGATTNYGFRGQLGSGSGMWNLYMDGGANNHLAGALLVGTTAAGASNIRSARNIGGAVSAFNFLSDGFVQSDVTSTAVSYRSAVNTAASAFTLSTLTHFQAAQGNIGAGSTVTTQEGFRADSSMVGATNNIGFRGAIPSGSNRWNLFMDGTAANFLAGNLILNAPLGFGASGSPSYGTSGQFLKSGGSGAAPSWGSLTSGEVTTALGFTPYNATNPSGYITNTGNARVGVENNGTLVGTRRNINFIPGSGISLSISDDAANEEVDITITSTAAGGGVTSFNTRTGAVTLSSADVRNAIGSNFLGLNRSTPSYRLHAFTDFGGDTTVGVFETADYFSFIGFQDGTTMNGPIVIGSSGDNFVWYDKVSSLVRMCFDARGNLAFTAAPNPWRATFRAFETYPANGASLYSSPSDVVGGVAYNAYRAQLPGWIYSGSGTAGRYEISGNIHAWYSASSGTAGGNITWNQPLTLDASGNLLVGVTSGSNRLVVAGNIQQTATTNTIFTNNILSVASSAAILIRNSTQGVQLAANATSWASASDERLKTDLAPIDDAVGKVMALRAATGRYKSDKEGVSRAFLIAQQALQVFPQSVTEIEQDGQKYLGLQYTDIIPLLTAAFQQQQAVIEQLKARLDAANL